MRRAPMAVAVILGVAALCVSAWAGQAPDPAETRPAEIDLAALMPPDTIAYAESGSVGKQIETAIGMLQGTPFADPLAGIQGPAMAGGAGLPQPLAAVLNPAMVGEIQKVRGWAVGFQGHYIVGGSPEPKVVAALDLGENNGLRPMLGMGIMMAGVPSGRIEGMDVVKVREPAAGGIAYDDRMVIYARPFEQLDWCVKQYKGGCRGESLATASAAFGRFDAGVRRGSALAVWADMKMLLPALHGFGGPEAQQGLDAAIAAMASTGVEDFTARLVLDPQDPFLEATVGLDAARPSAAYEMVRTGPLGTGILRCVPAEAIAVAAGGLSRAQAGRLTAQLPVGPNANPLSHVDHMALYMVPPDPQTAMLAGPGIALAESFGLAITVREGSRVEDVVESLRTLVEALALQAGVPVSSVDIGDGIVEFALPPGGPVPAVYLAKGKGYLAGSLNPDVVRGVLADEAAGRSALTEGPLHAHLSGLQPTVSAVVLASAADIASAVTALRTAAEPIDEELEGLLADLAAVLEGTTLHLTTAEEPASFTVRAGASSLPPLSQALPVFTALGQYGPPGVPVEPVAVRRSAADIQGDGNADDWAGVEALPWTVGGDSVGQARIAWREDGLYGLVTSVDDYVQGNDDQPWTDDGLQVFIETDNARRRGFSDESRGILLWPTALYGPGGANIQAEDHGGDASRGLGTDDVSGIRCAWGTTASGYAMEFYVPASALGSVELAAGSEIGLCMFLRNGSVTPAASFCADENPDTWQRPDMWGAIRLSTN
jgi:hypothetical protein